MRNSYLTWIGVENSMERYERGFQNTIWLRLSISLDDPENAPYLESRSFTSPSDYSNLGKNYDQLCMSFHDLMTVVMTYRIPSSIVNSKSRESRELGGLISQMSKVY
jgi:hypothetical protein